jgi:hypothetical protein
VGGFLARRSGLLLLVVSLALPSAAQAQRGVVVDPDSPAGSEYRIPLEEARRHGAGDEQRRTGEGRTGTSGQPLFGEGIERAPSASAAGGSSVGAGGGGDGSAGESGGRLNGTQEPGSDKRGEAKAVSDEATSGRGSTMAITARAGGDDSEMLATVGIAGAVLAVGLVGGFGLRRLLRNG